MSMRNTVAVAGVGETEYSRDSGRSELQLALEATLKALDDAGIDPSEVDGIMRWSVDSSTEQMVASNLGVRDLAWFGEVNAAGPAAAAIVAHAASAIHAGLANVIVLYRGVNGRSGRRYGRGDVTGQGGRGAGAFSEPYGMLAPQMGLAMTTRRRMYEQGYTSRQFGMVAVTQRMHANRNPKAMFFDQPLSIEDHQNSRFVVDPLHLYDCCLETDGGGALVLTSADRARRRKGPVATIRAAAQVGSGAGPNGDRLRKRIFEQAGIAPSDVDVVQIYDHFSPFVVFGLESNGFVKPGEGGEFVESGGISWAGGELPVNTSGGHLSEAYLQGMNHLIEAVRQARGESTAQVRDARFSFVDTSVGAVIFERSE
ncbi:MAG: lipid-transfer protein [Rhodoglobus sp.]|nr:lipid-transfer protein [Rhodoglobus sp.]